MPIPAAMTNDSAQPLTILARWPFRMKAATAASYCDMSATQFHLAVQRGELPEGRKTTGGRYWLKEELEAAMVGREAIDKPDFSGGI